MPDTEQPAERACLFGDDVPNFSSVTPVLLFDRSCGFCRRAVSRWRGRTGRAVRYAGVSPSLLGSSVALIDRQGVHRGARAVFRVLRHAPEMSLLSRVLGTGPLAPVSEAAYRFIAKRRGKFGRLERLLSGKQLAAPTHVWPTRLFYAGLGASFVLAFRSLRRQLKGLIGEDGIFPAKETLERFEDLIGKEGRWRKTPTLFHLRADDDALLGAARAGEACGWLLIAGVAPPVTGLAAYGLYLSFVTVCREFLSFQWDSLILETALLASVLAPMTPSLWTSRRELSGFARLALRFHAARFLLESGLAKWHSQDPTWRDGTAMSFHYETQPLPTALGWRAHQLPLAVHKLESYATLALEWGLPILSFGPRRLRFLALAGMTGLQAVIGATGNYGFFNLLSATLGIPLLDDRALGARRTDVKRSKVGVASVARFALAAPLVALGVDEIAARLRKRRPALASLRRRVQPFHALNSYGLFAVMTTDRPELHLEGSSDGEEWKPYRFRFKPNGPEDAPRFLRGHMPRLDWLMWFAAMSRPPAWFVVFVSKLLSGSKEVGRLLLENPFPDAPPRWVRARVDDYRMTSRLERTATGNFWRAKKLGTYLPAVSLRAFQS